MTNTLGELLSRHDQDVLEHLDRQAAVPVVRFGRQGDVIVIPEEMTPATGVRVGAAVPPGGVAVVRGENGGNTHLLVADGSVRFAPADARDTRGPRGSAGLRLGTLVVERDATAFLIHPEHGAIGFPSGRYTVSRQREFDGAEQRIVAD